MILLHLDLLLGLKMCCLKMRLRCSLPIISACVPTSLTGALVLRHWVLQHPGILLQRREECCIIMQSVPLSRCSSSRGHTAALTSIQRCPAGHSHAAGLFTACAVPLPVCRWCCALTACSGIPASTCLVTSAPPQRVGGNYSSSGTSTKVKRVFFFFYTFAADLFNEANADKHGFLSSPQLPSCWR